MKCLTNRFGQIEFGQEDVVTLPEGLLGFPERRRFVLICHNERSPFRWLQSVEEPQLAFLVIDPASIHPSYSFDLPQPVAQSLHLESETPVIVYVIVSIPRGKPEEMTANLAGPLVINAQKRIAAQVVVEEPEWSPRHPVGSQVRVPDKEAA